MKNCKCKPIIDKQKLQDFCRKIDEGYSVAFSQASAECLTGVSRFCPCGIRSQTLKEIRAIMIRRKDNNKVIAQFDRIAESQRVNTDIIKTITSDFAGLQEIAESEGWAN